MGGGGRGCEGEGAATHASRHQRRLSGMKWSSRLACSRALARSTDDGDEVGEGGGDTFKAEVVTRCVRILPASPDRGLPHQPTYLEARRAPTRCWPSRAFEVTPSLRLSTSFLNRLGHARQILSPPREATLSTYTVLCLHLCGDVAYRLYRMQVPTACARPPVGCSLPPRAVPCCAPRKTTLSSRPRCMG